uniref:Uncharacterized protein n=1 Tax=Setaria italica TaxID=4555 RepID=K3XP83_SETIT
MFSNVHLVVYLCDLTDKVTRPNRGMHNLFQIARKVENIKSGREGINLKRIAGQ